MRQILEGEIMRAFFKATILLAFMLQSVGANNDSTKVIHYENQTSERFQLSNQRTEVYEEEIEVDAICTKKIPYEENVCRDVVKYKKQ